MRAICSRLRSTNPNVQMMTLVVLDTLAKNCGALVHEQLCTVPVLDTLNDLVRVRLCARARACVRGRTPR